MNAGGLEKVRTNRVLPPEPPRFGQPVNENRILPPEPPRRAEQKLKATSSAVSLNAGTSAARYMFSFIVF